MGTTDQDDHWRGPGALHRPPRSLLAQPAADLLGAPGAIVDAAGEAGLEVGFRRIQVQAHDVNGAPAPGDRDLDPGDQGQPEPAAAACGLGQAIDGIVIGQGHDLDAHSAARAASSAASGCRRRRSSGCADRGWIHRHSLTERGGGVTGRKTGANPIAIFRLERRSPSPERGKTIERRADEGTNPDDASTIDISYIVDRLDESAEDLQHAFEDSGGSGRTSPSGLLIGLARVLDIIRAATPDQAPISRTRSRTPRGQTRVVLEHGRPARAARRGRRASEAPRASPRDRATSSRRVVGCRVAARASAPRPMVNAMALLANSLRDPTNWPRSRARRTRS